jgi:hypothetical protein
VKDVRVIEVADMRPVYYLVYVDGKLYDSMPLLTGPRLTWAQMGDIEDGYREYFASEASG